MRVETKTAPLVKVGEIAKQVRGVTYSKHEAESDPREGYLPILRAMNITEHGLTYDGLVYVPTANVNERQMLQLGDIVVAASSGSLEIVGKASVVETQVKASFGAFCKVVRPGPEVYPAYLGHFFRTPGYRSTISKLAQGANINNLKNEHIGDLEIPLPPLDEQKRIAAVLDKADALRRQRQESLQLTEKLLQSVFLDMFGDPVDQPQISLSDLLKKPLRNGLSPASGGKFAGTVFTLSAITRGFFNSSARKKAVFAAPPKPTAYVDEAEFLICRGNGNLKLCGQGQFPSNDATGIIFPDTIIAAAINLQKVSKPYFATLWNQPFVRHQIEAGARTAAGIFKVNQTTLGNIQIPVPPFERQIEFGKIAAIIKHRRTDLDTSAQYADNLFSSLQQHAFRGELGLSSLVLDPSNDITDSIAPARDHND